MKQFDDSNLRSIAGALSLFSFAATWGLFGGIQIASVPQVVAFSIAYAVTVGLVVAAFRHGGLVNLLFATLSATGIFLVFCLLFFFS